MLLPSFLRAIALYAQVPAEYGNLALGLVQLFSSMLGNFDYSPFVSDAAGLSLTERIWGAVALTLFLVLSAVLLLSLLVAIITYRCARACGRVCTVLSASCCMEAVAHPGP